MFYKSKPWLKEVLRQPNVTLNRQDNVIRLDKSERLTKFPSIFFQEFINSLKQEDFICYPETGQLIEKLCEYHNLERENIFLVPGADAAIKSFFELAVSPGDEVLIPNPCFPMYSVYGNLFNAKVVNIPYSSQTTLDIDFFLNAITEKTALIAIANPNSPIGDYIENSVLEKILKKSSQYEIPVLVDEAYTEYSPGTAIDFIHKYENVGIARTFSKAFGGAGIRIGYIVGGEKLITGLSKWRLMYEVNQVGVRFAIYLLNNLDLVTSYAKDTIEDREQLIKKLSGSGYEVVPSKTNWIHFHARNEHDKAIQLLDKYKVLYKLDSRIPHSELKKWVRINIGSRISDHPFVQALITRDFCD